MKPWVIFAVCGVLLLILGSAVLYGSVAWDIENRYFAWVTAPEGVRWTLWLPMPELPVSVSTQGAVLSFGTLNTLHGTMYNVTGTGNVNLAGTLRRTVVDLYPLEWQSARMDLSGREASSGFWIWRASDNPSAAITLSGGAYWRATYLGGEYACGGPAFQGDAQEGWTLVGQPVEDCVSMIDDFPWSGVGATILAAGAGSVSVGVYRWRRSFVSA